MNILDEASNNIYDEAGEPIYDERGVSLVLSGAVVTANVYVGLSVTATIECNVGAPYQGDIRNLATDRWYSMYPS